MDAQENGLTLEGLAHKLEALQRDNTERMEAQAQRLEALERENERVRSENAELRGRMAAPTEAEKYEGAQEIADEERVSRRALLTKAGAAAAAVAAGTMLLPREARAESFASVDSQSFVQAKSFVTALGSGVWGESTDSALPGVRGESKNRNNHGVVGVGKVGVVGSGDTVGVSGYGDDGVYGTSRKNGFSGVYGRHTESTVGPGVTGDGKGNWPGVWGRNPTADGVTGETGGAGFSGVYGRHTGTAGYGVTGVGKGASGFGVVGKNFDAGGTGVLGEGTNGYGGQFQGGKAQLFLKPAGSTGRPGGAHAKGEVYMDAAANLFVCVRSGTPGTWREVATTAV